MKSREPDGLDQGRRMRATTLMSEFGATDNVIITVIYNTASDPVQHLDAEVDLDACRRTGTPPRRASPSLSTRRGVPAAGLPRSPGGPA